jgi:hypothetical protein
LCNAPGTFQRAMHNILQKVLYEFPLLYLDDIIVFSKKIDDHITHLNAVFELLGQEGLKLKLSKGNFFKTKIEYFGNLITVRWFPTRRKESYRD